MFRPFLWQKNVSMYFYVTSRSSPSPSQRSIKRLLQAEFVGSSLVWDVIVSQDNECACALRDRNICACERENQRGIMGVNEDVKERTNSMFLKSCDGYSRGVYWCALCTAAYPAPALAS